MTEQNLLNGRSEMRDPRPAGRPGFTLIELLLAMFIFALGLVAVVSLFPVGSALQADAVDEAMTRRVKDNVQHHLQSQQIDMPDGWTGSDVSAVPATVMNDWPIAQRCYPLMLDTDGDGAEDHPDGAQRRYYWVPLVRKDGNQWQVFVFIVRSKNGASYTWGGAGNSTDPSFVPKVGNVGANGSADSDQVSLSGDSGYFSPGDQVLSNDGIIYTVEDIEGSTLTLTSELVNNISALWYARAENTGRESPTRRIFAMGAEAVK